MKVLYFGCIRDTGHYLFDSPDGGYVGRDRRSAIPFKLEELDGQHFLPGQYRRDRYSGWPEAQSVCRLTQERGWTLLGCWDRTVDTRPGSNSTFLAEGAHSFEEMVAIARQAFPDIVKRIEAAAPLALELPQVVAGETYDWLPAKDGQTCTHEVSNQELCGLPAVVAEGEAGACAAHAPKRARGAR